MAELQEGLKREITRIVNNLRANRPKQVTGLTRQQMSDVMEKLPPTQLDEVFAGLEVKFGGSKVSDQTQSYVHKFCYDTLDTLNALSAERRFFVLQTINLLGEQSVLTRFIELLLLEDTRNRKALAYLFLSTFKSTHEVILTLTSAENGGAAAVSEAEKGELYVFRSDLARKLLKLFPEAFVQAQALASGVEDVHPIELLINIVEGNLPADLRNAITGKDEGIVMILVDYLVLLQTHYALYIYAIKRYAYLKNFFLHELRQDGRLRGFPAAELSRIAAGALAANEQLAPPEDLIHDLIRENSFNLPETIAAEEAFLDKLAPSTLDALIRQVHTTVKKLARSADEVDKAFVDVRALSEEEGILARLEAGFLELVQHGVIAASDLVRDIGKFFKGRMDRRRKVREAQQQLTERARKAVEAPKEAAPRQRYVQVKSPQALQSLARYRVAITDEIGFRGGEGKTIARDYAESMMVFGRDEVIIYNFKRTFFNLFEFCKKSPEFFNKFEQIEQPHPTGEKEPFHEYYIAFRIPDLDVKVTHGQPHLLALGLTHFPRREAVAGQLQSAYDAYESEVDPYVILFVGNPTPQGSLRAISRKVNGKGRTFNQLPILEQHVPVILQALHDLLHLLPEEEARGGYWNEESTQTCLAFLRKSLARWRK